MYVANANTSGPSHASQLARVLTVDPQALTYVLNSPDFQKTDDARFFLGDTLGRGWPKLHSHICFI